MQQEEHPQNVRVSSSLDRSISPGRSHACTVRKSGMEKSEQNTQLRQSKSRLAAGSDFGRRVRARWYEFKVSRSLTSPLSRQPPPLPHHHYRYTAGHAHTLAACCVRARFEFAFPLLSFFALGALLRVVRVDEGRGELLEESATREYVSEGLVWVTLRWGWGRWRRTQTASEWRSLSRWEPTVLLPICSLLSLTRACSCSLSITRSRSLTHVGISRFCSTSSRGASGSAHEMEVDRRVNW